MIGVGGYKRPRSSPYVVVVPSYQTATVGRSELHLVVRRIEPDRGDPLR
jgi:hypothetical protein